MNSKSVRKNLPLAGQIISTSEFSFTAVTPLKLDSKLSLSQQEFVQELTTKGRYTEGSGLPVTSTVPNAGKRPCDHLPSTSEELQKKV